MRKKREIDMTVGPCFSNLFRFALPLMISGILQSLYNAADTIVVGHFAGQAPLAAVGATANLSSIFTGFFMAVSVGTSMTVAVAVGARDRERLTRLVHSTYAIAIAAGLFTSLLGFFTCRPLLKLMATPDDILDLSTLYLRIVFSGCVFSTVYNYGAAILNAAGDSKRPLYYLTLSGLVNVVLNVFFVIVLKMTVEGVALATVISQFLSALLVTIALVRSDANYKLELKKIRFHKKESWDILRSGLPSGVQSLIFCTSNTLIQSAVNSFGTASIAGNTAASNLDVLIWNGMVAYRQTAVTAVGQNMGAGNHRRVKTITWQILLQVTVAGMLLSACVYLLSPLALQLYLPEGDPAALAFAEKRLMIMATTYFICGTMDSSVGLSHGLGHTILPMIISVTGVCGVRIVWLYTVFPLFHTPEALFLSYTFSWLVTGLIQLFYFLHVRKKWDRAFPEKIRPESQTE